MVWLDYCLLLYLKRLSIDVRVHVSCAHAARFVGFIADGAFEWTFIAIREKNK